MGSIASVFGYLLNALYMFFNNYRMGNNSFFINIKNYIITDFFKTTKIIKNKQQNARRVETNSI